MRSLFGATRPPSEGDSVRSVRRSRWSVGALALLGVLALVAACTPQPAAPTGSTTTTTIAPAVQQFAVGDSCDPVASRYQFLVAGQGGSVQALLGQNLMLMYPGVVAFQCVPGGAMTVDPMTKISVGDFCAYNDTQNRGIFVYKFYDGQDEGTVRSTTDALGRSVLTCVPSAIPPTTSPATTSPTTTEAPTTTTTVPGAALTSFAVGDSCDPMSSNYQYLTAGQGGTIQAVYGQDIMLMYPGVIGFQCRYGPAASVDPMTSVSVGDYCTTDGVADSGIFVYKFTMFQVDGTVQASIDGAGRDVLTCVPSNPMSTTTTSITSTTTVPSTTTTEAPPTTVPSSALTSFAVGDSCDAMGANSPYLGEGRSGTVQPVYGSQLMLAYSGIIGFKCVGGPAATVDPMTRVSVGDSCTYGGMRGGLYIYRFYDFQSEGVVELDQTYQVLICRPPTP